MCRIEEFRDFAGETTLLIDDNPNESLRIPLPVTDVLPCFGKFATTWPQIDQAGLRQTLMVTESQIVRIPVIRGP